MDAGRNHSHGNILVDERNPIILYEDGSSGDWLGEYAVLLANNGGPPLAGIITNTTKYWSDVNANAAGWNDLISAARMSGLQNIPDVVTPSTGAPLVRPSDGQIDSTAANHSAGAQLIIDLSNRLSQPWRPVVVTSGTSLTDIADAYLVDRTVVDRVVVVAMVGSGSNGAMVAPNGDLDPWADWIVAERFRYVQVSAYYDQTVDVTKADLARLPSNALGNRIASKQPNVINVPMAADQVALLAQALPRFAVTVQQVSVDTTAAFDPSQGPPLIADPNGTDWIVTQIAATQAEQRFWEMLTPQAPATDGAVPGDAGADSGASASP